MARVLYSAPFRLPPSPFPIQHSPVRRAGISLLEVLISMFVLLFGLMGVAMVFPIGNHYAGKGEQYDRSGALANSGFAELKARGMLRPEVWMYAADPPRSEAAPLTATDPITNKNYRYPATSPLFIQHRLAPNPGTFNMNDPATHPGYAFVIDPMGAAEGLIDGATFADVFPYAKFDNATPTGELNNDPLQSSNQANFWMTLSPMPLPGERWPIRRLTLPSPDPTSTTNTEATLPLSSPVAESIFQLRDDLTVEMPKQADRPGIQRWAVDRNGFPEDEPWNHVPLARQYGGSYSWLATIVPTTTDGIAALQPIHPQHGSALYEVSVAVLHKRAPSTPSQASERAIAAAFNDGGELVLYAESNNVEAVDAAVQDVRTTHWIAVAGVHSGTGQFLLKWYRLLSLDEETTENGNIAGAGTGAYALRRATVDGPEWPRDLVTYPNVGFPVENLQAILLPGVIGVATQTLPMESQ